MKYLKTLIFSKVPNTAISDNVTSVANIINILADVYIINFQNFTYQ